jgi:7-carboxy-7-deazaguanine synthase
VIANLEDWNFTKQIIERYELDRRAKILISPAWGAIDLKNIADWVSSSGLDLRLQLQLHKYIWGPEARAV